ncbi:carbohydrate ABC transporter permease [Chelatococcus daeguensis]|uniref:Sugar ABC transporter permease n=2 Tax=Chelatococcus TaxID=28209 RepID=A0AAC9NY01_9HYPH|nr:MULTISPECIES: carbohydrate ABC transporter permease [Chelatococcus]APF36500.1 sugar ABC transporter permease [Chelatococcus daeguensis]KZE33728.1 sugar ABC transporter permease [Chelatococcus daeguensis]MBM3082803.1 carbohydrate ABC transporter permease [Chelatococcus daeguensis]CUA89594.1 ABC-type glycerol-3-phosphate transport system, permease component [Chelatococcus sambhunathii]
MIERRSRLARVVQVEIPVLAIVLFALAPYAWMVITSFKPNEEIAQWPVAYWPSEGTLQHYRDLLARTTFAGNLLNSFIVAVGAVTVGLLVSVPAAYAFSRFRFRGRRFLMVQFLVVNMFPIVLIIIPLFVLMRALGLLDTFLGVIAGHSTFAIPFSIWMMTSYMNAIPPELDEAAIMDGASRLQTIRLVILPIVMPGIVTTGIYIFVTSWNEYLFAMMLSGQNVRTVTVALQLFIGEFTVQWGLLTAGGTLVAIPVTILFLLVQRRLVGGLTAGAVKS